MKWLLLLACGWVVWAQGEWRDIPVAGRTVRVQVVEGEALWQGDIVLGAVERVGKGERGSAVITGERLRWPGGVIPYVIDDDVPEPERVEEAIGHWNEKTGIRLVARGGEANYVQFRRRNGFACSSNVGMIGGRQFINLPDTCARGSVIHEIGHAVGLFHTQSREDRDLFVRVNEDGIERVNWSQYESQVAAADDVGAYPYDSIMHYWTGGFALGGEYAMATVPEGIPVGQRDGLAASDLDTVARILGMPLEKTLIASNPSGLEVVVDGEAVRTPAEFTWAAGTRHRVRVEDVLGENGELRFARWSDFGDREHEFVAGGENSTLTVHMRRLWRMPVMALPEEGGRVAVQPEGWIPEGGRVELRAEPAEGFQFTNWSGLGYFSLHGSANPARLLFTDSRLEYNAGFTTGTVTTVTSEPAGLRILVDGTAYTAPHRFVWAAGTRHEVGVEAASQTTQGGGATHTFRGWSDGGEEKHTITAGAEGSTVTAEFETRYQVLTGAGTGGRVVIDPPVTADRQPAGATVTVTAEAASGYTFAGWEGNRPGGEARKSVTVDGVLDLQARFAQPGALTAAGLVNAATYLSGAVAPGEIIAIFGAGYAAPMRVLFDGVAAPVLYVTERQVGAVVPFGVAGKSVVRVQLEQAGRMSNSITVNVAAAAPGLFTAAASGRGSGAILNSDGSLNGDGNPAERGSIVVLWATGFGEMRPGLRDGELAGAPYAEPVNGYVVRIGERVCEVLYGGAAPGLVAGVVQLNVRVPGDIGPGVMPVSVEVGGVKSPRTVSLAVR